MVVVFYNDVPGYTFHRRKNDLIFNFSIFSGRKVILVGSEREKKGKKCAKLYARIGKTKKN